MKTLIFDIETAPAKVYVWDLWNQNIGIAQIIDPVRIIAFTAKWVGEDSKFYGENTLSHTDLIQKMFNLFDEAEAIVTYNGDRFDIPHANREFTELGLGRPSPFASIDLYKVVKKHHKFLSNKLAWVTQRLELSGKRQNDGWPLWIGCLAGEKWAWDQMEAYCVQDGVTTEELYELLLVWIDNHPNLQLYEEGESLIPHCPKCLSADLQKRGTRKTKVSVMQQYQCQSCGSWSTGGKRLKGVDVR